ncbi:MAG: C69 family dipeptidase, partial [Candidatus Eisenbacteria bacterium]|nr:C69 family dipeptidase [Candidatus Eisenbacteria bacterium]
SANKARIGEFPIDDPENCLHSKNVISFAVEMGFYDPQLGLPFSFCDAYDPATPENKRYCSARVWSLFRRAAPSQSFSADYHRGVEGAEPYPLWIHPDKKISLRDVIELMRDHYEGTPYDMTKGIDAGPYACPKRWRPLSWSVDEQEYAWERSISTQQTGFSFISQSRSWLPDPIGGIYWYGLDDTYMTCYMPLYCGIDQVPHSFTIGDYKSFSWDAPWWVFNFVSNFACLKFSYMIQDIQTVQRELENGFLSRQPAVEKAAVELEKTDPALLTAYLTDYSLTHAEAVVTRWRQLGENLMTKYNDGYVKNEEGRAEEMGYPKEWLRRVLSERPGQFKLKPRSADVPKSQLTD